MTSLRYVRKDQDKELPEFKDNLIQKEGISRKSNVTGLRDKKLLILIIYVVILCIVTFVMLAINLSLISVLQMNTRGMKSLRFHKYIDPQTDEQLTLVDFAADKINLGHVVAKNNHVYGGNDKQMKIEASRVIISGSEKGTKFTLNNGICRIEDADDFQILNRNDGKIMFSAQNPLVTIDRKIKQISTKNIVTNKIRSPINEDLSISGENINIRGNEGIIAESKRLYLNATTAVRLKTSPDGSLRLQGKVLRFGTRYKTIPVSTSPALSASVDAYRLCICGQTRPKLFIVDGNKPCTATSLICS
uniref:Beta-sarcoglycan n=1 Tax=Rhabditophanes sp. KR3021 TaxID=114890 RepID=A0AC35TGQ3_9BILA